jgi:hypothetical protein
LQLQDNPTAAIKRAVTAFEDFVTEQIRNGRSMFGLYSPTDEQTLVDFAVWRKKKGR